MSVSKNELGSALFLDEKDRLALLISRYAWCFVEKYSDLIVKKFAKKFGAEVGTTLVTSLRDMLTFSEIWTSLPEVRIKRIWVLPQAMMYPFSLFIDYERGRDFEMERKRATKILTKFVEWSERVNLSSFLDFQKYLFISYHICINWIYGDVEVKSQVPRSEDIDLAFEEAFFKKPIVLARMRKSFEAFRRDFGNMPTASEARIVDTGSDFFLEFWCTYKFAKLNDPISKKIIDSHFFDPTRHRIYYGVEHSFVGTKVINCRFVNIDVSFAKNIFYCRKLWPLLYRSKSRETLEKIGELLTSKTVDENTLQAFFVACKSLYKLALKNRAGAIACLTHGRNLLEKHLRRGEGFEDINTLLRRVLNFLILCGIY